MRNAYISTERDDWQELTDNFSLWSARRETARRRLLWIAFALAFLGGILLGAWLGAGR